MKKRILALLLALVMVTGMVSVAAYASDDPLTVALVVADKFGDRSFYDSSKAGCDKLVEDLGVELKTIECNGENHTAQMQNAADVADVVVHNYANTYTDPAVGKECAIALNDEGADVIFQIASATGDGVFEAAAEKGFYAIGVDSDQKYIDPEVIICSMKKEVGDSIYAAISELVGGDDSRWGTTWVADMSTGYIGIGYGEEGSEQQIPDELKESVADIAEAIISGEIVVDTTRS